jgi:hypothetical protein
MKKKKNSFDMNTWLLIVVVILLLILNLLSLSGKKFYWGCGSQPSPIRFITRVCEDPCASCSKEQKREEKENNELQESII